MLSFLKLKQKLQPQTTFLIGDDLKLNEIKLINRKSLDSIPKWLTHEVLSNSIYKYGVPDNIYSLLDKNIGEGLTYTDLLAYYSRKFGKINYLELGVSVGKNFFQFANQFENSQLIGFDIENINPVLSENFALIERSIWPTIDFSLRKEYSSLSTFNYRTNTIKYIAGDIWDENSWSKLKGQKFNLIFSDALHDPKALIWEYEMLEKYELIDDDFIIFWDDLNNGLEKSFEQIALDLKRKRNLKKKNVFFIKINGWLGQNYPIKHDIGIVTNLQLN